MPDPINAASAAGGDLVTISILVDGTPIPDTYLIMAVRTEQAVNQIPTAQITLQCGTNIADEFMDFSSKTLIPGSRIDVKAGYRAKTKSIFKGLILKNKINASFKDGVTLTLTCQNKAIKTTLSRNSIQFTDMSDADAISNLATAAGVTAKVSDMDAVRPHQIKHYASDWDFIRARARSNGCIITVSDGAINIGKLQFKKPQYVATYGEDIIDIDLEMAATGQLAQVTARTWNPKTQKVAETTATEPKVNAQGDLTGQGLSKVLDVRNNQVTASAPLHDRELSDLADAHLLQSRMALFQGHVTVPGVADLMAGDSLEIKGLGDRFNGLTYVAAVTQVMTNGTWTTTVDMGLPTDWDMVINTGNPSTMTPEFRPPVGGLQIAKVLQTHEDPDSSYRIKVNLPLVDNGDQGHWVRIASPYASVGVGILFLPEIDDEVVIGFLDEDPNSGIVLGALHSTSRPPPYDPGPENTHKGIVTREDLKLHFDDGKKIIKLETPGGHRIILSDDDTGLEIADSNGNKLKMDADGLTLSSNRDITISANGKVSISGRQDADISGLNITLDADISVTANGGATAELNSGGTTTVKGSSVQIN